MDLKDLNIQPFELVEGLKSPIWKDRNDSLQQLSRLNDFQSWSHLFQDLPNTDLENIYGTLLREIKRFTPEIGFEILKYIYFDERVSIINYLFQAVHHFIPRIKIEFCVIVLDKPRSTAHILKSIQILSETRNVLGVFPTLMVFKSYQDIDIIRECHKAFRKFKDIRIVAPVIDHLNQSPLPSDALIYEDLLTLIELKGITNVSPRLFLKFTTHSHPKIRRAAILGISTYKKPRLYKKVFKQLSKETNRDVQIEIIKHLSDYPTKKHLQTLLNLVVESEDDSIILAAESAIDLMPENFVQQYYRKSVKKQNSRIRSHICLSLANFEDTTDIPVLLDLYNHDKEEQVRSQAAEALGTYKIKTIDQLFYEKIISDPSTSYSSTLALVKSIYPEKLDWFVNLLKMPDPGAEIIQQTVLERLSVYFRSNSCPPALKEVLLEKLQDDNINLRYYSMMALGETRDLNTILPMLQLLFIEDVPENVKTLEKSIIKIVGGNYQFLLDILNQNPEQLINITRIISQMSLTRSEKFLQLKILLKTILNKGLFGEYINNPFHFKQFEMDLMMYLKITSEEELTSGEVSEILRNLPPVINQIFDVELSISILNLYRHSAADNKFLILPLFKNSTGILKDICREFLKEENIPLKEGLQQAILNLSGRNG